MLSINCYQKLDLKRIRLVLLHRNKGALKIAKMRLFGGLKYSSARGSWNVAPLSFDLFFFD
jgi:hypothetical protein